MSELLGWNVFGVAIAVLGIVIVYALMHRKAPHSPKD